WSGRGGVRRAVGGGGPPFGADGAVAVLRRVCDEPPRPIRELNPDVPDWLCAVIARLHAKDPAGRFQSATEVAEVLGNHLAGLQQPAGQQGPAGQEQTATVEKPRFPKETGFLKARRIL